jgi:putative flippase GtrA
VTAAHRRFVTFNGVGALGVGIQLATVHALLAWTPAGPVAATAMGVTAAVVHNFVWHRVWTWRDRSGEVSAGAAFARFVLANGAISLAGNVLIVGVLVRHTPMGGVTANALAIAACGIVNYLVSDRLVFVDGPAVLRAGLRLRHDQERRRISRASPCGMRSSDRRPL